MHIFPNYLCVPIFCQTICGLHPTLEQTQYSLLRPLWFHARLDGEKQHPILLLLGEGGFRTAGGCGHWDGESPLNLPGGSIPHKQLIIHDEHTGRENESSENRLINKHKHSTMIQIHHH